MKIETNGIPKIVESFEIEGATINVVTPAFKIEDKVDGNKLLKALEKYGRVCYKSEERTNLESAGIFIKNTMDRGHFSIIEHEKITVRVICDRGVSHEWVRHRIASYSQESTRYCNYGKLGFQYIYPSFFKLGSPEYLEWKEAIKDSSLHYLKLLKLGCSPQWARGVLPNSLKTEIIITHNLREWRHLFYLRCSVGAHPQIREIAIPILKQFQKRIPVLFDDFEIDKEEGTASTKIIT